MKKFKEVLWDINNKDIDSLDNSFLIKRVLVYGGVSLLREVFNIYGFDKTKEVFLSLRETEVGKRRYHFFKNYLFI